MSNKTTDLYKNKLPFNVAYSLKEALKIQSTNNLVDLEEKFYSSAFHQNKKKKTFEGFYKSVTRML